jgi:hypothetical protein
MFKKILIANRGISPSPAGEGLGRGVSANAALVGMPHPSIPSPEGEGRP